MQAAANLLPGNGNKNTTKAVTKYAPPVLIEISLVILLFVHPIEKVRPSLILISAP